MCLLLVTAIALALNVPAAVRAQPEEPAPADDVVLRWPELGLPAGITFSSPNSRQDYSVPVPSGLEPRRLRGAIHAPVNFGAGYLEIDDDQGRFVAAANLPVVAPDQASVPFDVDISAAHRAGSAVPLSFTVRQVDGGDLVCGPAPQLVVTDLSTDYGGVEPAPNTIATFFPAVLRQVTLYAPVDADNAEKQTVLTLASALARLYRPQPVATRVVLQPRGTAPQAAGQFNRAIVVAKGDKGALRVENAGAPEAYLRVSGSGDQLVAQTSLLVNEVESLAQVPAARVEQPGARALLGTDTLTFSQLKIAGKTDVLGTGYLSVGVDRAALGVGRVDSVRVHLLADYTPTAEGDAATLVVRSNGIVVHTETLDSSGHLDATFDLANQMLTQRVGLDFVVTYASHLVCSAMVSPLTFQVDPRSTLTITRGGIVTGGFQALPSDFSPGFVVAMDGSAPQQLDYAVRAVTDIARLTATQLTPRVVDIDTAAKEGSGALVIANAQTADRIGLTPPLAGQPDEVRIGLPTELTAHIDGGLGSIQAYADREHNRTVVLVTTMGDWSLVDSLFGYVDSLEGGWSSLKGDVLAIGAGGTATNVTIRDDGPVFEPPPPTRWRLWATVSAGFAVALAGVLLVAWLLRRRRRQTRRAAES